MYGGGGVACVCLSLATVYLLLFVWFVAFHVVFFSFFFLFFIHCLFFFLLLLFCSSKEKEEEKGEQDEWKKKTNSEKKKANQGDKGGIARETWNTKIRKHNKEEKQNRKEKKQTFCCFCRFGLLASLWAKPCQGQRAKKHYETRVFVAFFRFICWSVIGQANDKNNNKNKTTKTRQQNYKTTKNNTWIKTKQQQ